MKIFSIASFLLLSIFVNSSLAQFFHNPESVTYDTLNARYLISNVMSGDIVQISDLGDTTYFDTSLGRTLGMTIVDNILYVADISGLVLFDITTDQKITIITFAGMIELNDVAADSSGYLYITDSSAGRIYRMKISDHSYITIVNSVNVPNGILFDAANNRILFCQFVQNAPIKEINLSNFLVTTVLSSTLVNFDGLAIDGNGNIYVSCWGTNSVYRYDNTFSLPVELISSGHSGPADIFYNKDTDVLAVPNVYSHTVNFIPITPMNTGKISEQLPHSFCLFQNYPNPFNPSTKIKYSIPRLSQVTIKVFDVLGNEIETLINEEKPAGTYELTWHAKTLTSGIYFYQLRAGILVESEKMILLR